MSIQVMLCGIVLKLLLPLLLMMASVSLDPPPPDPLVELLVRLERSAESLKGFKTDIRYIKVQELLGRKEIRQGELIYQLDGEQKRFAVMFDQLQVGNRLENRPKHYVFDGK